MLKNEEMFTAGSVERNKEIGPWEMEQIMRSESQPKLHNRDFNYESQIKGAMSIDWLKEKESTMKKTVSTGSNSTTGIRGSKVSWGSSCDTNTP